LPKLSKNHDASSKASPCWGVFQNSWSSSSGEAISASTEGALARALTRKFG
jgi:hypothetical protein